MAEPTTDVSHREFELIMTSIETLTATVETGFKNAKNERQEIRDEVAVLTKWKVGLDAVEELKIKQAKDEIETKKDSQYWQNAFWVAVGVLSTVIIGLIGLYATFKEHL